MLTILLIVPLLALGGFVAFAPPPPLLAGVGFSPLVLDRHGNLLRMALTADEKYRVFTPLSEVAPHMVRAVLLYEDRWFYQHPGVNPFSLVRAGGVMLLGGRRMGGSTITMQVARLRLGLETTTLTGKLEQLLRALQLDWHYSKREILEAYFNLAPYGGNVEGVGAAARLYFHRAPSRLTFNECLALAVVPQNPGKRSPLKGAELGTARVSMHRLWREQVDPTVDEPLLLRVRGPGELPFVAPHAVTEVLERTGKAATGPGGGVLRTTLDSGLQRLLETHLLHFAANGRPYGLNNASALLLHWPSLELRALAGSANFHQVAIEGQVDGTRARRSPGSTLKPFIYALALDQGLIHPQTLLTDTPRSFGGYDPENFDRQYRGPIAAQEALRSSRNIPAIWLASRLHPDLYALLRKANVALPHEAAHYGLSLVLGGAEMSMRELAELYAMLANRGIWRPARLLAGEGGGKSRSLLSPEAAILTLRMLEAPGRELRTRDGNQPLRFKTGTSNRFRDAWTIGILGPYVLAVWVGNFDNRSNPLLVGGEVAAPLFEDLATALSQREPLPDMVLAQQEGLNIVTLPTCTETGDTDVSLCRAVTPTLFIPGRSPTRPTGIYRTILVDIPTGLRACEPSASTREEIWPFWPSELQALFARAGILKPSPPDFLPQCSAQREMEPVVSGAPPRILVPKEGLRYQRRVHQDGRNAIPLTASADADTSTLFWFIGDRFLGSSAPDVPLLWQAESGKHLLRVVDDRGRAASRAFVVDLVP